MKQDVLDLGTNFKVSVKENEVPTEKNSSCASIFATNARYQIEAKRLNYHIKDFIKVFCS